MSKKRHKHEAVENVEKDLQIIAKLLREVVARWDTNILL